MKQIFTLIVLAALGGAGYFFYMQSQGSLPPITRIPSGINITQSPDSLAGISSILGTTTSRVWESGINILNGVTNDQAEPIINKAVSDLQERVKELPQEQYEKVKYEFCKDVIETGVE